MRRICLPQFLLLSFFLVGALVAHVSAASATDLEVRSKVDAVTIFSDAALVSRVANVELPPGHATLIFKDLPIGLDPASLQVLRRTEDELILGSVTTRVTFAEPKPDNAIEARLKELRSDREGWQVTLDALEAEKAMMLRYSQAGPETLAPDSRPLDVSDWTKAWDTIGAGLAKLGDEIRSARIRVRELNNAVTTTEAARARPAAKPEATREVAVESETVAASKARITLTYRVAGAHWRPRYEARLEMGGGGKPPALEFSRRAAISQATGEDWSDVALTVSTAPTQRGLAAPEIEAQGIGFRDTSAAAAAAPGSASKSTGATAPERGAAPAPLREAMEWQAAIDVGSFTGAFEIVGRASLAGDGTMMIAPISARRLVPDLSIKTAPALDPTAYLMGRFANMDATPLPPGEVTLYRDGSYLGSSQIGFVPAGGLLDLSFGGDDQVAVSRLQVRRGQDEANGFGQTKTETREVKTIIENRHDFPLKITLLDALPVAENAAIVVEQLPASPPPTEKMVAGKRGVMSWAYDYAPLEKREIRLSYRLKWPADREVRIGPAPLPVK